MQHRNVILWQPSAAVNFPQSRPHLHLYHPRGMRINKYSAQNWHTCASNNSTACVFPFDDARCKAVELSLFRKLVTVPFLRIVFSFPTSPFRDASIKSAIYAWYLLGDYIFCVIEFVIMSEFVFLRPQMAINTQQTQTGHPWNELPINQRSFVRREILFCFFQEMPSFILKIRKLYQIRSHNRARCYTILHSND